ncbi:hypothetical protein Tco_0315936 [Tanacetum coccineum]
MNNEVDKNTVDKQCAEIVKKNLLIENENLIANCLSTQLLILISCEPYNAKYVTALIEQNDCDRVELEKTSTMVNEIESLKAQLRSKESCSTSDYVKPKVLAPGMYAIDIKPNPHPLKNNRSAHLNYINHLKESVETVREIVEEARVVKPLDNALNYACQYTKLSQELLEYVIGTCPKSFNERDNKAPSTPVTRKKQVTFSDKPGTSSSNTQKHEVHQKIQQTNVIVIPSTRVNDSTEASGSKPRSNTKKNRIMPAKKEVEVRLRTNNSVCLDKKNAMILKLDLQHCKEKIKQDKSFKENQSKVFLKEREQYFEIQDLKAQLQDKDIAINSLAKKDFSKSKPVTTQNVSNDFSKPVTAQILPQNMLPIVRNTNVIAPGMYKVHTKPQIITLRPPQLHQDIRKPNKRVSFSTGVIPNTSVSRPQLKSNHLEDRVMSNNSQGKKQEVEDHRTSQPWLCLLGLTEPKHDGTNLLNIHMPLGNASRTANILEHKTPRCSTVSNTPLSSNSFAARRDSSIHRRLWVLKAHDRNLTILTFFVEKFSGHGESFLCGEVWK